jgi:hypothetical protein
MKQGPNQRPHARWPAGKFPSDAQKSCRSKYGNLRGKCAPAPSTVNRWAGVTTWRALEASCGQHCHPRCCAGNILWSCARGHWAAKPASIFIARNALLVISSLQFWKWKKKKKKKRALKLLLLWLSLVKRSNVARRSPSSYHFPSYTRDKFFILF